jgi:hypothetical protein
MSFFATTALPTLGCNQNADNDIDGYPINFDIEERNYISPQLAVALVENKLTKKQWHCFHCQSLMKKCNITKQYICVVCNHLDKNYNTNKNSENGFFMVNVKFAIILDLQITIAQIVFLDATKTVFLQ